MTLDMPGTMLTTSQIKGFEAYTVMGTEDYYESAFEIRHSDGNPTSVLKYVSHTQQGNETIIQLRDSLYPVSVTLHYQVYPHEKLSTDERTYLQQAVREWKRLKPVIFSPSLYRLVSPYEGNHCVLQRNSEDGRCALVFAYDLHPRFREPLHPVRLQGLDPQRFYEIHEIMLMPNEKSRLVCHDKTYTGDYLMKVGLPLLTTGDMSSRIVEINKLKKQ